MIDQSSPLWTPTDAEAARFLSHATMGYTLTDIKNLSAKRNYTTYWQWLDEQLGTKSATSEKKPISDEDASYEELGIPTIEVDLIENTTTTRVLIPASREDGYLHPKWDHFSWLSWRYGSVIEPTDEQADSELKFIRYHPLLFVNSFLRKAILSKEQLRLKVSYALSQIITISGTSGINDQFAYLKVGGYFDLLTELAFTSYEKILKEVTRSPLMAEFLTYLGSEYNTDGKSQPDENFARELLQLFTIGPVLLNTETGLPIVVNEKTFEAYDSGTIAQIARIFAGAIISPPAGGDTKTPPTIVGNQVKNQEIYRGRSSSSLELIRGKAYKYQTPRLSSVTFKKEASFKEPLTIKFPQRGNDGSERAPYTITINSDDPFDRIDDLIKGLLKHTNAGLFIARLLIQRLTTSNPSAGYIARVAAIFNQDDVRGNMPNVIRAILMDEDLFTTVTVTEPSTGKKIEKKSRKTTNIPHFGRILDPFERLCQWACAFRAIDGSNQYKVGHADKLIYAPDQLGQAPMCAPSVFNFYRSGYTPPNSSIASSAFRNDVKGVSPEMQNINAGSVIYYSNFIYEAINRRTGVGGMECIIGNYDGYMRYPNGSIKKVSNIDLQWAGEDLTRADLTTAELVDTLNVTLCRSEMTEYTRAYISWCLEKYFKNTETIEDRIRRAEISVFLTMISPDYIVLK